MQKFGPCIEWTLENARNKLVIIHLGVFDGHEGVNMIILAAVLLLVVNAIWIKIDYASWSIWGWLVVTMIGAAVGGYFFIFHTKTEA